MVAHRLGIAFAVLGGTMTAGAFAVSPPERALDDVEAVVVAPLSAAEKASWGVEDQISYVVSAWSFQDADGDPINSFAGLRRTGSSPGGDFLEATLELPTGARVVGFELQGCDNSTTEELALSIVRITLQAAQVLFPHMVTGTAETPGCGYFAAQGSFVVNNFLYAYVADAQTSGNTGNVSLGAVRIYYKLQVSPPPSSATFSDVPTGHPFFRYVEALAASGITSGCGGNRFCPGAPLTRGQMAVFLAKALGLHWPN